MFKQNTKKQTTLGFAPKPSARTAGTAAASATRHSSRTPAARPAPYSRPSSAGDIKSHAAPMAHTKSPYFSGSRAPSAAHAPYSQYEPKKRAAKAAGASSVGRNLSRSDSFGSSVSAAVRGGHGVSQQRPSYMASHIHGAGASKVVDDGLIPSFVKPPPNVALSEKQLEAFNMAVNQRESLFITGSAGTGKSVLMREIIKAFKGACRMGESEIQITASTGIAAFHVGGRTIHSFAGVGYGKGPKENILAFVRKSGNAVKRWNAVKVLIIDEISMLDAALFDALEYIARSVRKSHEFFGGIQLILTGDFYQLPPVEKSGEAKFAFEAEAWRRGIQNTIVLTHVFRQKDMRFVDMLNEMRLGRISDHSINTFKSLARKPDYPDDGIQATELYALRNQVDDANHRRLRSLDGKLYTFCAHDAYDVKGMTTKPVEDEARAKIDGWSMAPRRLELKLLAQVMLIKNMPEQDLVNGSRGVIIRFEMIGVREYPVARFTNGVELTLVPEVWEIDMGREKFKRTQLPIILAWALSIHKSQGQTIDRVLVDLGKVFEKGQAYVALSRAVKLEALQVLNFQPHCVMAHPRVIQYYAELARKL